ncbi:MAG: NAD(+)/NADH kinase [Chloroflexota bacterium]
MTRAGILYHPQNERATILAGRLQDELAGRGVASWRSSAWDDTAARPQVPGSDLVFSVGGDGTILHAARIIGPLAVPIVGVNVGKLGFICEVSADDVLDRLPELLGQDSWVEERAMLCARTGDSEFTALNDVAIRNTAVRVLNVEASVDGEYLTTYRADGLVVATATGSTGYALAAGGPVLHPQSADLVLQPISAHLCLNHAIVLPRKAVVKLVVKGRDRAILSVDGQLESPFEGGQSVTVSVSPHTACFVRTRQDTYFYATVSNKLKGS